MNLPQRLKISQRYRERKRKTETVHKEATSKGTYWQRIPLTWRLVLVIMALLAGGLGGTG